VLSIKTNTRISGYFQSFKYVKISESKYPVRELLKLKEYSSTYQKLKKELDASPYIAIHIRRGNATDPFSRINSDFHGLLPSEYYNNAYKLLRKLVQIEEYKVIVFTDNKVSSRLFAKEFSFPVDRIIAQEDLQSQQETMYLIAGSKHFVGANSSFSWWAAYLGESQSKITIFPKPWYKKAGKVDQEILWPHWLVCGFEEYL
jgi:hypothetical protein